MRVAIDIQLASTHNSVPEPAQFEAWLARVAPLLPAAQTARVELSLRVVDESEMRQLNRRYRGRDKPTNVLSFPCELPPGVDLPLLGDVVLCAGVIAEEARQQHKSECSHWAHMLLHGTLHLLGHDHQSEQEAEIMETLEIQCLAQLGYANPYLASRECQSPEQQREDADQNP